MIRTTIVFFFALVSSISAQLQPAQPPVLKPPTAQPPSLTPPAVNLRPPPPLEKFPSFGGVTAEQFHRSNISLLASKVLAELNAVKLEANRSTIPPVYKPALLKLIDGAIAPCDNLRTLAGRNAPLAQLQAADTQMDAAMTPMAQQVARFGVYSNAMMESLGRAQYADQQLHAALHQSGPGPENRIERIRRAASLLEDQAETLRDLSRTAVDANPAFRELDRAARIFSFRSQRFDRTADEVRLPGQLTNDFADVLNHWRDFGAALATVQEPFNIRMQSTRVEGTMRIIADLVPAPASGWDWTGPNPLPGPGFLGRGAFAVGAGEGGGPRVRLFANRRGDSTYDFFAYDVNFVGGVRIAMADLTGDGVPDLVTAPGPGLPSLIRVFDGRTMRLLTEFYAFDAAWTGGVFVAAANRTRDGRSWVAVSADAGAGPYVKVFDLAQGKEIDSFSAFDQNFRGGVRVALGDVNGDGLPDVIAAPGPGMEPLVRVFDGRNRAVMGEILAFDRNYLLGLNVAVADLTRNGRVDLIVGSEAGGPAVVRVYDTATRKRIGEFAPFPASFRGGVRVSPYDFDRNGTPDIACAPGRDPNQLGQPVRIFSGVNSQLLGELHPFGPEFRGGAFLGSR